MSNTTTVRETCPRCGLPPGAHPSECPANLPLDPHRQRVSRSRLGRPLTVVSTTAACDGKHQHEALLITDGTRAHGHLLDHDATDLSVASRTGTVVEWACRGDDTECTGYLRVDLSTPGVWVTDSADVDLLAGYGTQVER